MTKLNIFLVVLISTCILVQGTVQPSNDFECQCCDQCDRRTATEAKVLSNISNLLDRIVNSDLVTNTTSNQSTTSTSNPTTTSNPTSTSNPTTILNPSTTSNPTTTYTNSVTTTITKGTNPSTTTITTGTNPSTTTTDDALTKIYVCPENCYLDASGQYCNCYQTSVIEEFEDLINTGP